MTVTEFLEKHVALLAGVSREDAGALARRAEQVPTVDGQLLVLPRGRFAGLYVVAAGAVRVAPAKAGEGEAKVLGPGEAFGEGLLIGEGASRASYAAVGKGLVFILPASAVAALFARYPEVERRARAGKPAGREALEDFVKNFEVVRVVGRGGMGAVYEARDLVLDRMVAIKRMAPELRGDAVGMERFMREARITASLRHPNIVEIHSVVEAEGEALLVLEFVRGRTLADVLEARGSLPPGECLGIVRQAGAALEFAHSRKVVHRDLKPSNIMLSDAGVVKVMDFGVARVCRETLSRAGGSGVFGTLGYMAPEQHDGRARRASDLYALGVTLYEMLTGVRPFLGPDFLTQKQNMDFVRLGELRPALGTALDAFMARALAPAAEERHPGVRAFLDDFEDGMARI